MTESLHTHTTLSDGKLTHRELFLLADSLGVSVLAFTDHDAVPSPEIMRELETLRDRKTKWVIGTEMTADLPSELKPNSAAIHIIGLFIDPTNEAMLEHCRRAQESRIKRMHSIVDGLKKFGFTVSAQDCLEASGGDSIGRPHIVQALNKYPENNVVLEKIRLEMAHEAESNPVLQSRYNKMMERGVSGYYYTLVLSPDSFRSAYFEHDYMPNLDEAVALIRGAGGIASIAHYYTIRSKMPLEFFDKLLKEKRIDGAEIIYGLRGYGTSSENTLNEERATLRKIIAQHDAIATGGSDAHTREDLEKYATESWFSDESIGLTEKILATGRVNKKFSSLM